MRRSQKRRILLVLVAILLVTSIVIVKFFSLPPLSDPDLPLLPNLPKGKLWGIDISHHQRHIDWDEVMRENRPHFVIHKATEGLTVKDRHYKERKKLLEYHGVVFGAYHFFSYRSPGKLQAIEYIKTAKLGSNNVIPVLDAEFRRHMPGREKVIAELKAFCKVVEKHYGVKPIIYTDERYYKKFLKDDFAEYDYWICELRRKPSIKYIIWQHSHRHHLKGIRGGVDRNVLKTGVELESLLLGKR